jgi:aminoglycoside phosphotransferase (APT) family kinase protein
MIDDTIPVRPDERFDEARLAAYLRDKLEGAGRSLAVRQFGGGAANLTYLLDYGTHQYVLRRPPLGPVAPSAHDMAREYRVLSVLYRAFPLAPRALLFCDDPAVIGAPFFVMERRHGVVVRRELPPEYAGMPEAPRRMSETLVNTLADLHAVDYEAVGLAGLGKPRGFVERQIEGWYKRWQAAKVEEVPAMDALYAWLRANRPPEGSPALVHNDYKLDNAMLARDDPGRIVAIFDWDMCTLGDPLSDLGALLAYWTEPVDPPHMRALAMMPPGDVGFLSRRELVQRYAQRSGRDVSHIRFYHALALYRVVVIIAQIYVRYVRGQTQDHRFAAFGPMIPSTAQAAFDVAQERSEPCAP